MSPEAYQFLKKDIIDYYDGEKYLYVDMTRKINKYNFSEKDIKTIYQYYDLINGGKFGKLNTKEKELKFLEKFEKYLILI